MTTQYMEEGGFKKKFLAPLVVIMLCAVALAGAAYAWSTSVHGDGNIPGSTYYTIDMYSDPDGKIPVSTNLITVDNESFVAYTTKNVTGNYIGCTEVKTLTFETYVKVLSNSESKTCVIEGVATYSKQDSTASMYDEWAGDTDKKITAKVTVANDGATPTNTIGTTYKVTVEVTLPALSVNLGEDATPTSVPTLMSFDGTGCISINLTAGPVPVGN